MADSEDPFVASLPYVQSASGRLQDYTSRKKGDKSKSVADLSTPNALRISSFETRRRSRSVPLSLEATQVASELKRLSDTFNRRYSTRRVGSAGNPRNRRHTFATSKDVENRRSFHFDYENYPRGDIDLDQTGTSL